LGDPLKDKVHIVGVLDDGIYSLPLKIIDLLHHTDLMFGGERHLAFFPNHTAKKIPIKSNLQEIAETIQSNLGQLQMAVLASGDPNFYGIAKYLIGRLGKEAVEIVPNVSAMQLAFARIKESWDDAFLGSVHARPIEAIIESIRNAEKAGLFTDDKHTPAQIAGKLLESGIENRTAYVCENLGGGEERVTATDLKGLLDKTFSPLNVLIVKKP
jgi:precorrin-6Y C5,15-methyltransferase (decarboxylating)